MSAWTWNTSVSAASNGCCHRVVRARATWISSGLTRTRLPPAPSPTARCRSAGSRRPARAPISWGDLVVPPVLGRAAARDDLEARVAWKLAPHLVGDPVGEVGVRRVAQVLEGQHREPLARRSRVGWLRRQVKSAASRSGTPSPDQQPRPDRAPAARLRGDGDRGVGRGARRGRRRPERQGELAIAREPVRRHRGQRLRIASSTAAGTSGRIARTLGAGSVSRFGRSSPAPWPR